MKMLTAIDLCCGAGGWACAARTLPIRVVVAVDMAPAAVRTYQLNHPTTKVIQGDVREKSVAAQIEAAFGLGMPDIVLGAVPCHWLSKYRRMNSVGTEERTAERRTLDSVLGLVRHFNPQYWCIEDVVEIIKELPPMTPYLVIDASTYSPQRRKRAFVGDYPPPDVPGNDELLKHVLRDGPYRIGTRALGREVAQRRTFDRGVSYGALLDKKAPTICNIGSRRDAEMVVVDPRLPGGKRQMEWQEAASLQGFPPDYVFVGSPTDVCLMVAVAIQIDVGRAILAAIVRDAKSREVRPGLGYPRRMANLPRELAP